MERLQVLKILVCTIPSAGEDTVAGGGARLQRGMPIT